MHPPLNIAAVLACSNLQSLKKGWGGCRAAAAARGVRSEAALAPAAAPSPAQSPDRNCQPHAKHFAAAVFGWGKWQAPTVGVDLADLLDDEPIRNEPAEQRAPELTGVSLR